MHNSLKRAVSIAIAAIALFSLPCGSIFARTHIDIECYQKGKKMLSNLSLQN